MLQPIVGFNTAILVGVVSNPISGEVGAAAAMDAVRGLLQARLFQTPSAGRWVLQRNLFLGHDSNCAVFQTPSAGRWVLQLGTSAP